MTAVTSLSFGFFLLLTVPLYWLLPAVGRRYFLLAAGLVFLGLISLPLLLLVLLLSSFSYWLGSILYDGNKGKPALVLGLLAPLGVLALNIPPCSLKHLTRPPGLRSGIP